jgi:glycerol-3-phosphate dehydrogenase (NAD(P)+)
VRATVLGAGAWGTALAIHLARVGHSVALWDHDAARAADMRATRRNPRHLRDQVLSPRINVVAALDEALAGSDIVVPVVPSHSLATVLGAARPYVPPGALVATATKGLEHGTLRTMHDVSCAALPDHAARTVVLTGPSFATEVARGLPTAVVAAGPDDAASATAEAFHGDAFRVYTSDDVVGACIGGSLKNVMAIATGVADGLGLGHNAIAGIITRGLAEASRLATAAGARSPLTMMGLAGLGDLVLTCTGGLSRNRRVGVALGQGRALNDVLAELGEVAEGVGTAEVAMDLAARLSVSLPITEQVRAILLEGRHPAVALAALLGRERRAERDA